MSVYSNLRKTESLPLNSVVKSTKPCLGSRSSLKIMYHCAPDEVIFKVPGSLRIHPSLWSKEDVIHWLRWAEEEYSLKKTDDMKFAMNGRGLCILTKNDFKNRCPSSGDVLYELLSCIMTRRQSLLNHPIFRQPMRQTGHQKSHTPISTTKTRTAASQTSNDSTTQASVMDINQDGPLNLSNKIHSNQEKVPKLTKGNSNIQIKEHVPA